MNIFQEIKERLSLKDIIRAYGIELNRSDMCVCPFHSEKTPSMKVYDKGFRCYGCNEGGDTIEFVRKFFKLNNTLEAAHKINEDFGLGIATDKRPTKSEVVSAQTAVQKRVDFEHRDKQTFLVFSEYFKVLQEYSKLSPKTEYEIPDKRFVEYLHNFEKVDFMINQQIEIMHNPMNERLDFLNDNQNYISKIAERLLEIRNEKSIQQETPTINKVESPKAVKANSDYKVIGNTSYRNIQDKTYLKYSNSFAAQIANKLDKANINYSGKISGKMTTFTVNKRDLNSVRNIASAEAERFTGRNKPQIIPSERQMPAGIKQNQNNEMTI